MRNKTGEQLTQAQATLKQIRQMLESTSVLNLAGEDRQRRLKSNLAAVERDLALIQEEAEIRDDPVSRMARGDESQEVRDAVIVYETLSE